MKFYDMFVHIDSIAWFTSVPGFYKIDNPKNKGLKFWIIKAVLIVQYINCLSCIFFELLVVKNGFSGNDFELILQAAEAAPCLLLSFYSVIKVLCVLKYKKYVCSIVLQLNAMWSHQGSQLINETIEEFVKPALMVSKVYALITNVLAVVYNLSTIAESLFIFVQSGSFVVKLPFYFYYPFKHDSMAWFVTLYLGQVAGSLWTTLSSSLVDCFLCILITNLCLQLNVLSRKLKRLNSGPNGNKNELIAIIKQHNMIMNICNDVESVFTVVLFINFTCSSLMICGLLLSITMAPPERIHKYCLFLSSAMCQLLMLFWYGDKLIRESMAVSQAAYDSDWCNCDDEYKQMLLLIQLRAQKPLKLTALKFAAISLNSFASILSCAWSYFTIMRTMFGE